MPAWASDFTPLIEVLDGDDFIAELSAAEVARDKKLRKARTSSVWARARTKSEDTSRKVFDLMRIRGAVSSIVKIHGAPTGTTVELAVLGKTSSGCAGWKTMEPWTGPHIYLDAGMYDWCDGEQLLDAYCGLGIHEAEHLISTRRMLLRLKSGDLSGDRASWEQLLEDERIENLARDRSPGFAPYLHASKRVFFGREKLATTAEHWDKLPDLDKLTTIIFFAIRCPYMLTPEMREWKTIRDRCAFEELRGVVPRTPTTELHVEVCGKRLLDYYNSLKADYDSLKDKTPEEALRDILGDDEVDEMKEKACADDCTDTKPSKDGESKSDPDRTEEDSRPSGEEAVPGADSASDSGGGEESDDGTCAGGSDDDGGGGELSSESDAECGDKSDVRTPGGGDRPDSADGPGESGTTSSTDGTGGDSLPEEEDPVETTDTEDEGSPGEGEETGPSESVEGKGKDGRGAGDDISLDDVIAACDDKAKVKRIKDLLKRVETHAKSVKEDEEAKALEAELKAKIAEAVEGLKDMATVEAITEKMKDEGEGKKSTGEKVGKLEDLKKTKEALEDDRKGRRFGLLDLAILLTKIHEASDALSREESEELARCEDERIEFTDPETCPCTSSMSRRTVIVHPKPTTEAKKMLEKVVTQVRPYVARTKSVLDFRLAKKVVTNQQLVEGHLDRRMVGRARTTDRIFKSVTTRVAKGLAVCLVLDESGSMGTTGTSRKPNFKSRAGVALQIAVLFAKSLQRVPGVELEIYSYGSCRGDNDNLIKYLYGKRQPDIASICGYGAGAQNYDHMAIRECGNLFKENTDNENRLMLVVSDGSPCGNRYGGPSAIKATHDVVKKLEKEMHVVQIAITSFASEQMFSHYIRFLDLRSLIGDMRKLLVRIIRSVS